MVVEIVNFGTQTTHLNQTQIDEGRGYLSQVYGNYCGANSDNGEGCGKSAYELHILWYADQIRKGRKDPKRKHPMLVINEKKGYGLHRIVDNKFQIYGNINYFCKSCNMIYCRRTGDIKPDESATFQARKSHDIRPKFKNKLRNYLVSHTHVCYAECINKWSGSNEFKCSQDPLIAAFNQEFDVAFDLIDINEFNIQCDYKKCNGQHIIILGEPPVMVNTDYDSFMNELSENKSNANS